MSSIVSGSTLAEVGALIGDPARANILAALMAGRALTATELAWYAGVSAQTTSGHLAKLCSAQLIVVNRQGRHRYHRIASAEIARAVEALMSIAAIGPKRHRPLGPRDQAMRVARTCYDHLAGKLATDIADSMRVREYVLITDDSDGAALLTDQGYRFLREALGIDIHTRCKRPVCRTCLDWSERRPHLAGQLGSALCSHAFECKWIERANDSRAVSVTRIGRKAFENTFGVTFG